MFVQQEGWAAVITDRKEVTTCSDITAGLEDRPFAIFPRARKKLLRLRHPAEYYEPKLPFAACRKFVMPVISLLKGVESEHGTIGVRK
jgi:hypothetical protein